MKFISLTIVAAFLGVAVVSALPPTFKPLDKTDCILHAVQKLANGTALEDEVKDFVTTIQTIRREKATCIIDAGIHLAQILKCKAKAAKDLFDATTKFGNQVFEINKELANELLEEVKKCFAKPEEPEKFRLFKFNQLVSKPLDKIKCALNAVNETVQDTDLASDFKEFEAAIQKIRKEKALCIIDAGINVATIIKCELTASKAFFKANNKFVNNVSQTNKELAKEISKAVKKCFVTPEAPEPTTDESFE